MNRLILASNNTNKLIEFRELFAGTGIEITSQREAGIDIFADESGATFEENAYIKAKAVSDTMKSIGLTLYPCVADDSGLCADALSGAPGVLSARYGAPFADTDEDRNNLLLKNMQNHENRAARFVCCICCVFPDGRIISARGECEGKILYAPRGTGGFGYDPIFEVKGTNKTMAELLPEEKNIISHRGKALEEFFDSWNKIN